MSQPAKTSRDLHILRTDVLILGGGVAGLSAAIAAASADRDVLVVTKDSVKASNTAVAQGGVAAVLGADDSFESHIDDTLTVGCGLCDPAAVRVVVSEGPDRIRDLIDWGSKFDRENKALHLTLEGGHSQPRVVHANGDQTGLEVQRTLIAKVREHSRIRILEHAFALDLLVVDGVCAGAVVMKGRRTFVITASSTILATGGAGQLFRETTNPEIATGDGLAIASRAGLELRDMEFVQFHPTSLYVAGAARHLITEAVRGEGGFLRDESGERYMVHYHPDAELAPRDVVSRSTIRHLAATGGGHVYLDLTHLEPSHITRRFPTLIEVCRLYRLDATKDLIPVMPSAHYLMGGIPTDVHGATSMPRLFSCGETASTGLHGANRLASNSLLEGLVFGRRSGVAATSFGPLARSADSIAQREGRGDLDPTVLNVRDMVNSIRSLMWRDVGIVRSATSLDRAVARLREWSEYVFRCRFQSRDGSELVNILMSSLAIAHSARLRTESRGAHFRTDCPQRDDQHWLKHSYYSTSGIHAK